MNTLIIMIKRNIKLFFKDKGMFFTSLITPVILLILYSTFLAKIYRESFTSNLPDGFVLSKKVINGLVGGEIVSSILAVSCVTITFCSNFLMVQDKVNGSIKDFRISPIKPSTLSLSYYIANIVSTLIVCYSATLLSFIYLMFTGWCLTSLDVFLILLDVFLIVLFGSSLSSLINFFLKTQGQISAVGTVVSSCYGFICGAYMPISSFSNSLQNALSFLPGTYATSIIRNHCMGSAINQLSSEGVPSELITGIKDSVDCNIYFFNNVVSMPVMYIILISTTIVLLGTYIILNIIRNKKSS